MAAGIKAQFSSRAAYMKRVKHDLRAQGVEPIKATYDQAGNCDICGEAGRCPGWHSPREAYNATHGEDQRILLTACACGSRRIILEYCYEDLDHYHEGKNRWTCVRCGEPRDEEVRI